MAASREPRANHEAGVAYVALPLLLTVAAVTTLLGCSLDSWWCATIPMLMLAARARSQRILLI